MTPTPTHPAHDSTPIELTAFPTQSTSTTSIENDEPSANSFPATKLSKANTLNRGRSIRSHLHNLLNKRVARRTFHALLVFGTVTLVYQAISLIPAFQSAMSAAQALKLQGDTGTDGRQTLAYGFLQECANRKVRIPVIVKEL